VVASFLTKHLLVDWREGARFFLQHLMDGDLPANNGGWQWVAGTGTDAAPYHRIFNPVTQAERFDPAGDYIRRWVPELAKLEPPALFAPWQATLIDLKAAGVRLGTDYPHPIVDHITARNRALARFQEASARSSTFAATSSTPRPRRSSPRSRPGRRSAPSWNPGSEARRDLVGRPSRSLRPPSRDSRHT
jgi:deoxyribodipyrimidine photo-lyase